MLNEKRALAENLKQKKQSRKPMSRYDLLKVTFRHISSLLIRIRKRTRK